MLSSLRVISFNPQETLGIGYSDSPGSTDISQVPKLAPSYTTRLVHAKPTLEPRLADSKTHAPNQLFCNNWRSHPQASPAVTGAQTDPQHLSISLT